MDTDEVTPADVSALLAACNAGPTGIRNRAMIMAMFRSDALLAELLAITPDVVDFDHHTITAPSGKVRRFDGSADESLRAWLDTRPGFKASGVPLFCTLHGERLLDSYVREMLRRCRAKAGITKPVSSRGLRAAYVAALDAAMAAVQLPPVT